MGPRDVVGGIDFSGESFVVRSALVGLDYAVESASGEQLVTTQRKFFAKSMKYEYKDDDDRVRFRYETGGEEAAGQQFQFVDATSETTLATLERTDPESSKRWAISTDGAVRARVESEQGRIPLLKSQPGEKMSVTGPNGESLGSVERRILAVRFTFDVELTGLTGPAKAAVLLAIPMLYDLMQERSVPWELGND